MVRVLLICMALAAFAFEGILLPLYHYPAYNDPKIARIIELKKRYPKVPLYIIINPNNGHFRSIRYNFAYAIKRLHDAGVGVLGYVHTEYGKRALDEVLADIAAWKRIYGPWGVEGIFVDEVNGTAQHIDYYRTIAKEVREKFGHLVFNPGTSCDDAIAKLADITVVYESNRTRAICDDKSRCSAVLLHGVHDFPEALGKIEGVEYIYVTPSTLPNPWEDVSLYLEDLMQRIEANSTVSKNFK